jgi:hypothetical protein
MEKISNSLNQIRVKKSQGAIIRALHVANMEVIRDAYTIFFEINKRT